MLKPIQPSIDLIGGMRTLQYISLYLHLYCYKVGTIIY